MLLTSLWYITLMSQNGLSSNILMMLVSSDDDCTRVSADVYGYLMTGLLPSLSLDVLKINAS